MRSAACASFQSSKARDSGQMRIQYVKTLHKDREKLTLVTPIDKKDNVRFYTEKCGFHIKSVERDGSVALARFVLER